MPVRPSAQYRMADRLASGRLSDQITELRAQGLSYDAIASRLFADHGIEAAGNTVRAWARQLGIEPEREAAVS